MDGLAQWAAAVKRNPLTISVIDLIFPCLTYSPSWGLCEFLALFLTKSFDFFKTIETKEFSGGKQKGEIE